MSLEIIDNPLSKIRYHLRSSAGGVIAAAIAVVSRQPAQQGEAERRAPTGAGQHHSARQECHRAEAMAQLQAARFR